MAIVSVEADTIKSFECQIQALYAVVTQLSCDIQLLVAHAVSGPPQVMPTKIEDPSNGPCPATPMDLEEQDSPSLDNSSQQHKPERPSLEGIIAPKALSFDTIQSGPDTHLSQFEASSLPGPCPIIMSDYALQNTGPPPPPIQKSQPGTASAI